MAIDASDLNADLHASAAYRANLISVQTQRAVAKMTSPERLRRCFSRMAVPFGKRTPPVLRGGPCTAVAGPGRSGIEGRVY